MAQISRETRSGRTFSPYLPLPVPVQCPDGFDFPGLLQQSSLLDEDDALRMPDGGALGLDHVLSETSPSIELPQNSSSSGGLPANSSSPTDLHNNSDLTFKPRRVQGVSEEQGHRVAGSQSRSNSRRAKRRAATVASQGHIPTSKTFQKHVLNATSLPLDYETNRPSAPKLPAGDKKQWTLEELRTMGMSIVSWDGYESKPLLDAEGRVVAVLAGQPRSLQYQKAVTEAYDLLQDGAIGKAHRRGDFSVINCGILHQQGTQQPVRMHEDQTKVTEELLNASCFKALAGFASSE
ncbi:hypothetical protein H0H93_012472 [Arthromyces matolae]|nr:hypothetical protein H0H93_012472 [Arthromyces matolae]